MANTQSKPDPAHIPIRAELIKSLDVRRVQPGAAVFARVIEDWNGLGCSLRKGAIIEAKVETAQPRGDAKRDSELLLSFSKAQCGGDAMAPIDLVLEAVSWIPDDNITLRGQYPIVKRTIGPGGATGVIGDPKAAYNHQGLSLNGINFNSSDLFVPPPALHPGDVYGVAGVKLRMGAGPGRGSLLYSKKRDVVLDRYTQFLLLPTSVAFVPAAPSTTASASTAAGAPLRSSSPMPAPAPPAAPREFEPCSPPLCTVDLPASAYENANHPSRSIAIKPLGYAPRLSRDVTQLDYEEALMWVGEEQILVAFNPHTLVHRNGLSTIDAPVRKIHAALLDVSSNRVLSTVDWDLSDSGRFLWQLSGNQILVHAGNELRVYDSRLTLTSRFPLAGPLGFVRISPNGELMAIGIIKERHSPELHRELSEALDHNPEEDVDVLVLDKTFGTIAQSRTTSDLMPPTLLNEGQLTLMASSNKRYRLAMLTWENQPVTLARFSSACTPELSSIAPNLVFIRSCDKASGLPEFRALRADGQVVWRTQPGPEEFGHEAMGSQASRTFAIKMLHAGSAVRPGAVFHGSDLIDEEVRVYRASDGKRLSSFRSTAPAPSYGGYSLSPDGSQLAMISGGQIVIYPVPAN
jgi:hypothetical protein